MKLITKQIALIVVLLAMFGLVLACAAPNPPRVSTSPATNSPPPALSAFKVNSLTINPPETNPGVQVIVTAKITNTGNTGAGYTPKIRIEDVAGGSLPSFLYQNDVVIPAGNTQLLSFVIPTSYQGKYRVTWGEVSGDFAVVEAAAAAVDSSKPVVTAAAPDFTGVDVVTGQKITLSQFKGKAVLLNFVNYGCDPSVNNVVSKQLMAIKELTRQRSDFVPLSVFCGCCPPEVLRDFAKKSDLNWPWILDTDNSIVPKYLSYLRKYGYPTLVYVDGDQIIKGSSGYADLATLSAKLDGVTGKTVQ